MQWVRRECKGGGGYIGTKSSVWARGITHVDVYELNRQTTSCLCMCGCTWVYVHGFA